MESESHPSEEQHAANKAFSLEEANEEITLLLQSGKVTAQEVSALQGMAKDYAGLREKVSKLKSLLGRSAKAQREAKVELEHTQKRLQGAEREVERLTLKVEKLASRPTHMDLLADFETNFDRALLSAQQSGGQDTAAPTQQQQQQYQEPIVDGMLLQELSEAKMRIDHLESLGANLKQRAVLLERENKSLAREKENAQHSIKTLKLELRMAQMEAEHATRAAQDKSASLAEMQMEIDMVTKASMNASVRAAQGEEAARAVLSDRQQVQELQNRVQALQEWALASAEAKQLAIEHVRLLEKQLKQYRNEGGVGDGLERKLWRKTSSIVVGAGDSGFTVLELGEEAETLLPDERVLLKYKFDCSPSELSIDFNILKGVCDSPAKQAGADYLIKDRYVFVFHTRVFLVIETEAHVFLFSGWLLVVLLGKWNLRLPLKTRAHYSGRMQNRG